MKFKEEQKISFDGVKVEVFEANVDYDFNDAQIQRLKDFGLIAEDVEIKNEKPAKKAKK
jgi:hypothetical protein